MKQTNKQTNLFWIFFSETWCQNPIFSKWRSFWTFRRPRDVTTFARGTLTRSDVLFRRTSFRDRRWPFWSKILSFRSRSFPRFWPPASRSCCRRRWIFWRRFQPLRSTSCHFWFRSWHFRLWSCLFRRCCLFLLFFNALDSSEVRTFYSKSSI